MEFSRQEYWSGLTFPPPQYQIEPTSPASPMLQADSLPLSHQGIPYTYMCVCICVRISAAKLLKAQQLFLGRERGTSYLSEAEILILFWKGWKVSISIFYFFQFLQNWKSRIYLFLIAVIQKTRNKETKGDYLFSSLWIVSLITMNTH